MTLFASPRIILADKKLNQLRRVEEPFFMALSDYADRVISTTHLVKSEDLNHHHTLYAGRCVEWCVQMAYIAAQNCFDDPHPLVFISIRSLSVRSPAQLGDIVQITGRVDYVGESTIGIRIDAAKLQPKDDVKAVATGSFLFCTVDKDGRAAPHGLRAVTPPATEAKWKNAEVEAEAGLS